MFDNSKLTAPAMATAFAFLLMFTAVAVCIDADGAGDQTYDKDLGSFWSYTVQFIFDGEQAETVTWNFGDGSAEVVADNDSDNSTWNPKHTYSEKGVYYVTQTVTNPLGTASTVYKVEVLGFPTVILVYNNGSEDTVIQQTSYNATVEKPVDPSKEGYAFGGWFTDSAFTTAYDWNSGVTAPITLYAKWLSIFTVTFDSGVTSQNVIEGEKAVKPADPVRDGYRFTGWYTDESCRNAYDWNTPVISSFSLYAGWQSVGSDEDDDKDLDILSIVLIVIGAVIAIAALFMMPPAAIIGIIVAIVGVLRFMGVF